MTRYQSRASAEQAERARWRRRQYVTIKGHGRVPVFCDEPYTFLTAQPKRIGDEALIRVNGKPERVMLLNAGKSLYLVRAKR